MSNNYYYYYPTNSSTFPSNTNQQWSRWSNEETSYNQSYSRASTPYTTSTSPQNTGRTSHNQFYNTNNAHYSQGRYNSNSTQQYPWPQRTFRSKPRYDPIAADKGKMKTKPKKKKKPLSQNEPRRAWSLEEASRAFNVEKEYNKHHKNTSLIIKFPDRELNKEIVGAFHPQIENIYFQQPSTPRFCFVTLKEAAEADLVIERLNKTKFGDGYLTAEYKKDGGENQNIGPEDIDPLTLFVGNLAQNITKRDVETTYPKHKRVDIGFAKKMKYTRYAFVTFHTVQDSIEALRNTHNTQLYSKSLIVRFRRLNGTIGMPGESKPQTIVKKRSMQASNEDLMGDEEMEHHEHEPSMNGGDDVDLSRVKAEPHYSDEEPDGPKVLENADVPEVQPDVAENMAVKSEPGESDKESSDGEDVTSMNFSDILRKYNGNPPTANIPDPPEVKTCPESDEGENNDEDLGEEDDYLDMDFHDVLKNFSKSKK